MKQYYILPVIGLLILSCSQAQQSELPEFFVDTNQDSSLPLSEIEAEITAIELELTNESLINPDVIRRVIITENNIILFELNLISSSKVFVFNKEGEFIRTIGSKGQGPGEYNIIQNVAFDEKSKRFFIVTLFPTKIICYHLDGKFLKESRLNHVDYRDINYINDELFLECTSIEGKLAKRILYRMNENLQITDSIICWENYYERNYHGMSYFWDYIVKIKSSIYVYLSEAYPKWNAPNVKVLRDTLYRLEDNKLVPELKLKFKNDGFDGLGDKIIDLYNIFRSSRYIFAIYQINPNNRTNQHEKTYRYHFCYDTKTGKGYNMLDGYTDDINGIEKRVSIHPLHTDSEIFYYWHTNMKPDDREEPNPTLYIIKLKK